jgi:hypothetical protein
MENLPLKGAGVVGTNSSVQELTHLLAISHLSSFYYTLRVPSDPPPTSNQGIASCSSPWEDLSKLFLLKI